MSDFWLFARQMLRHKRTLLIAVGCAVLSATGLGIGMASMVPIMKLMLGGEDEVCLVQMAHRFNNQDYAVQIPAAVVERLPTDPLRGVILIIATLCTMSVVAATASFLHQYLSLTVATQTVTRIRGQAFRHVVAMPLVRVVERGPSEFLARIIRDSSQLQGAFLALTSKSVVQVTRGAACFTAALLVSVEVALLAPLAGILLAVILRKLGKRIRRATRGSLRAQERLLRIATEAIQGLRSVKANTAEHHTTRRFHIENKQVIREELRARTARALSGPIVETLATFMVAGVAIVFAGRILSGAITFPQFVVALGALAASGASFKPLTGLVNEIQAASAPAARLRDLIDEPREVQRGKRRPTMRRHRVSIEFDRVTLVYPGCTRPALDGVSLKIAHGERVAIVGPNGSGKTTLASLLPRLLRPSGGRVLIDGVDIESVSLRSLRRQIGVVTQETVLFRGSIAENIGLGAPGASRARIVEAARRAHADRFIMEMPGGYDADVAEQGASLSGGQRQRLAIARAIMRDPSILILDEATSQVDTESEAHIAAAIEEFCEGRTSLIIAHRFSTVINADRIVVMDEGCIVDQGTHRELLGRCELYGRLSKSQFVEA